MSLRIVPVAGGGMRAVPAGAASSPIGQNLTNTETVLGIRGRQEDILLRDVTRGRNTPGLLANMFKGATLLPMFKMFVDFNVARMKDLFNFIRLSTDLASGGSRT